MSIHTHKQKSSGGGGRKSYSGQGHPNGSPNQRGGQRSYQGKVIQLLGIRSYKGGGYNCKGKGNGSGGPIGGIKVPGGINGVNGVVGRGKGLPFNLTQPQYVQR